MSDQSIDSILNDWPFDPKHINVRRIAAGNRDVLQLRLDLGLLQMETQDRPDGSRPFNKATYLDYLRLKQSQELEAFELLPSDCLEIDREFVQYYHRRVCWLHLQEFANAVRDAEHSLQLMDFCLAYSDDEDWTLSHEQYRPFVLYHRTQAAALMVLEADEEGAGPRAIAVVEDGLAQIYQVFVDQENEAQYSEDELVLQLQAFLKNLKSRFGTDDSLEEQLRRAVGDEDYERAALLRDMIMKRDQGH